MKNLLYCLKYTTTRNSNNELTMVKTFMNLRLHIKILKRHKGTKSKAKKKHTSNLNIVKWFQIKDSTISIAICNPILRVYLTSDLTQTKALTGKTFQTLLPFFPLFQRLRDFLFLFVHIIWSCLFYCIWQSLWFLISCSRVCSDFYMFDLLYKKVSAAFERK